MHTIVGQGSVRNVGSPYLDPDINLDDNSVCSNTGKVVNSRASTAAHRIPNREPCWIRISDPLLESRV